MRILYIGDSHIRCMIDAALTMPPAAGVQELFYGAAGPQLADNSFSVENGQLIPTSPKVREMFKYTGGSETVNLKSFDACVFVSWCSTVRFIFRLLGKHTTHLPKHLFSFDQKNTYLLSDNVYHAYLQQGLQNFWTLYPLISEHIPGEKLVVQQPIKAEPVAGSQAAQREDISRLRQSLYSDLCVKYDAVIGDAGARFIRQPAETLTPQVSTRRELCLGSIRLFGNDPHEAEEIFHMNKDYGAICLRETRSALGVAGA